MVEKRIRRAIGALGLTFALILISMRHLSLLHIIFVLSAPPTFLIIIMAVVSMILFLGGVIFEWPLRGVLYILKKIFPRVSPVRIAYSVYLAAIAMYVLTVYWVFLTAPHLYTYVTPEEYSNVFKNVIFYGVSASAAIACECLGLRTMAKRPATVAATANTPPNRA